MGQWIQRDFERPDPKLVRAIGKMPTGILSDCMNRFQAMDAGIKPLDLEWQFQGPAFTVQSMESCNWATHHALTMAQPGDVLVIAAGGGLNGSVWGDVMTAAAKKAGLAGIVVDGCVRDSRESRAGEFPIFCRGACPGGPHKGWPGNLNVPVSCGGVAVLPGDIIVGDADGVVVVPQNRAAEVLEEAQERTALEAEWYRRIEAGDSTVDLLGLEPPEETR